jgi:hypothetical protein
MTEWNETCSLAPCNHEPRLSDGKPVQVSEEVRLQILELHKTYGVNHVIFMLNYEYNADVVNQVLRDEIATLKTRCDAYDAGALPRRKKIQELRAALKETREVLADVQSMCKWNPGMDSNKYRWEPAQGVRVDDVMKKMQTVVNKYRELAEEDTVCNMTANGSEERQRVAIAARDRYIADLKYQVAELQKDKKRMDYDEAHPHAITVVRICSNPGACFIACNEPEVIWHQTRRAALDAAMEAFDGA